MKLAQKLKRCSKCGEIKPTSEFYPRKNRRCPFRSECKECGKKAYRDRKERNQKYRKQYYKKHKNHLRKINKEYYKKHKEELLAKDKIRRENFKRKARELIGDKCVICGTKRRILYHEIHGNRHVDYGKYLIEHAKDFICLCRKCHQCIHWLTKKDMDTKKAIDLLILLLEE